MQRRRCVTRQPHDQKPIDSAMAYVNLFELLVSYRLVSYSDLCLVDFLFSAARLRKFTDHTRKAAAFKSNLFFVFF